MSRYEGDNSTALRSQAWLAEALEKLMLEKPYGRISVGDICARAQLSRQTFYNMFGDKDEVLHYCLRSAYEERFRSICALDAVTIDDIVDGFVSVVESKRDVLKAMVDNRLTGIVFEEISACVALFAGRFVREDERTDLFPYSEAMLAGAIAQMLVLWFQRDDSVGTDELASLLKDFMNGRVYQITSERKG
ncbi:transcriptional regulator AcrR family [Bifidobacterium eulemuris]|nr:transcriptional regulator AcrR family [Bifidobacterium eulemuris]